MLEKKDYVVTIMASHVAYIVLSIVVQSKSNKLSWDEITHKWPMKFSDVNPVGTVTLC